MWIEDVYEFLFVFRAQLPFRPGFLGNKVRLMIDFKTNIGLERFAFTCIFIIKRFTK